MSFPPGTEMFQFPGFALNPYGFRVQSPHGPRSPSPRSPLDSRYGVEGGLPHSEIPGSKLVRSSPRLIAAYHVLHRLSAPRHPPNALKALDRSRDRCPHRTGSRCKADPARRHGHKKTGGRTLSDPTTLLAEHDRRAPALAAPTATFPLHDVNLAGSGALRPASLQTCLSGSSTGPPRPSRQKRAKPQKNLV